MPHNELGGDPASDYNIDERQSKSEHGRYACKARHTSPKAFGTILDMEIELELTGEPH